MTLYEVEMVGVAREVYRVEADTPEEAVARWADQGEPFASENESMELRSVRPADTGSGW